MVRCNNQREREWTDPILFVVACLSLSIIPFPRFYFWVYPKLAHTHSLPSPTLFHSHSPLKPYQSLHGSLSRRLSLPSRLSLPQVPLSSSRLLPHTSPSSSRQLLSSSHAAILPFLHTFQLSPSLSRIFFPKISTLR